VTTNRVSSVISNMEKVISDYGWGVIVVGGDSSQPSFAYTLGLADKALPELLVIGLPAPAAHSILNAAARVAVDAGGLAVGRPIEGVANMPLHVRPVDAAVARKVCRMAAVRVQADLAVHQLVWPSPEGNYPGEEGCDERYALTQEPTRLV
jgi:hypothetical protein